MRTITDKIDAVTGIPDRARTPYPPFPRSVKIELTGRCNLRCAFCATAENLRDKADMRWDLYVSILTELRRCGVSEVGMFFLGESTILPWLPRAIAEAKRQDFPYVFLTTNGTALDEGKIRAYMEAGLDSLKFSLNYADAEQFSAIARVKASLYGKLVDNIKLAHAVRESGGYECGLFASYIDYDGEQGERMRAVVDELSPYLDEVYALPLYSQANLTGDASSENGFKVRAGNPGRAGNMRDPIPCWSLFGEARITWDGHLAACCFDHDRRFDMGDLNEETFARVWHSEKFAKLREAHLRGDVCGTACENCVAWG